MRFACRACGVADAIALGAAMEVTCPACGARQPRSDYTRALAAQRAQRAPAAPAAATGIDVAPWLAFATLACVGAGGSLAIGAVRAGWYFNLIAAVAGAFVAAYGVHVLRHPERLRVSAALGTDASGQAQWGAAQPVSRARALRIGRTQLVIGIAILVAGLFVGRLV
jgi:hypothetical protein